MKASVDDSCISYGLCVEVCPEVFELPEGADVAKVIVDEVPAAAEASCREAADGCPAGSIHLEE